MLDGTDKAPESIIKFANVKRLSCKAPKIKHWYGNMRQVIGLYGQIHMHRGLTDALEIISCRKEEGTLCLTLLTCACHY